MEQKEYEKRGYLTEDFRVFYLEELVSREIEYHYHSFDKIVVFFRGNIDYSIAGKSYALIPNDIILVPQGDPHKVTLSEHRREDIGYTRLVLYLSPEYLLSLSGEGQSLRDCFRYTEDRHAHVLRVPEKGESLLLRLAGELKETVQADPRDGFSRLYQRSLLQQFLIVLNRKLSNSSIHYVDTDRCNRKIVDIIHYINSHLTEDISINSLAERFYISKYHMMRQFKAETGYTIGDYANQKRLLYARELLKQGESVTKSYLDAGFREHSTFSRAYKQMFGEVPSKTKI